MKRTVVPAQVTTIEDRIVGNLGISQIILLSLPVLATGIAFTALPPMLQIELYKLLLLVPFTILCATLAVRIKGRIILFWIVVRVRFNFRPRYHVFNKNTVANREQYSRVTVPKPPQAEPGKVALRRQYSALTTAETIRAVAAMDNPAAKLAFTTDKKGRLYVRIAEVKQEG